MSFGKKLEQLINRGRARIEQEIQKSQQGQAPPHTPLGPPPIPTASKPGAHQQHPLGGSYYQPVFDPSLPVSHHFNHELGAHGWGNNELQNYVSSPHNSFHTPDGKLVVRAICSSHCAPGDEVNKYTSARLTSHQTLARNRGSLTVRLTPPCAEGVWPAFWLLPADPFTWPNDGEVDIFESWNGDRTNHSCLHWGHFNGEDWNKHRVKETHIPNMDHPGGHTFSFVWDQPVPGQGGRMVWFINGAPVMKAEIPSGTRPMADFRIIINIACGGNVCAGKTPRDGHYDFIIHDIRFDEQPAGGWDAFDRAWRKGPKGQTM